MTLVQIAMMAAAAKTLKAGGAYTADFVPSNLEPRVFLSVEKFTAAVANMHARPDVIMHTPEKLHWEASLSIHGARFFTLYKAEQLPQIGYHLVDGRPVLITEEAQV